jgi:hypothetical protein
LLFGSYRVSKLKKIKNGQKTQNVWQTNFSPPPPQKKIYR